MLQKLKRKLTRREQMSEAFILSAFLAFSGGFQDAYTFIVRDEVFANAQTGNIVLMSTAFMEGRALDGLRYLFPLLAFIAGVFIASMVGFYRKEDRRLHWRQGILILEALIMLSVGFMPQSWNTAANILISFSCAMQVQSFQKVCGNPYASTMCIGNLRSGTAAFSAFIRSKDRLYLKRAGCYFGVILIFALGAGVGGVLSKVLHEHTIWISCGILALCFVLMEFDRSKT